MSAASASPDPIAARLGDIAGSMASEAAGLTATMREAADHARDIAMLSADLHRLAADVDANVRKQTELLDLARSTVRRNGPVMDELADAARSIGSMAEMVGGVARRSRMLSLNARIEAARGNGTGTGFPAVAAAMTELADESRRATDEISARAGIIGSNVETAAAVIAAGMALVERERALIEAAEDTARRQHEIVARVEALTGETVERLDGAADGIGRVASAAAIVGMIARRAKVG